MRRILLLVALVVTALLLQVSVIDLLPLPGSHPDVLLVLVVAVALVTGPLGGAGVGFAAGLLADLAPPADHTLGRLALAFTLVGYASGMLEDVEERSVVMPMLVVAAAATAATGLYAGVGALIGDVRIVGPTVVAALPTSVFYDVVLTPFIVPLVAFLYHRLEPEQSRW